MAKEFYDKFTRRFGASGPIVASISEYPNGEPEALFEQKLVELSGLDKTALDVGCGSGAFTLRMSAHFSQVVGIDSSEERIQQAQAEQNIVHNKNAVFEVQNAGQTSFAPNSFDIVYSRRGPTDYTEYFRILKDGGYVVVISIGERDAWSLKQTFGRGQGFHEWKTTALALAKKQLQDSGYSVLYEQDIRYHEYYATYADLDLFLQSVPIFEDFDSEKDKALLETYIAAFQTNKGIQLPRHRFIVVGQKPTIGV
jgi:cyclopropane fatty-acyl-phospholipid synthase-like methyltransferase